MSRKRTPQFELPVAGQVFNLVVESGEDPSRREREAWQEAERRRLAREYEAKMQRLLSDCPGFLGADAPPGPEAQGKVVVDPARVCEAWAWLRRRFHVCESLELGGQVEGLVLKIAPRAKKALSGSRSPRKVTFAKPVQYELALAEAAP